MHHGVSTVGSEDGDDYAASTSDDSDGEDARDGTKKTKMTDEERLVRW